MRLPLLAMVLLGSNILWAQYTATVKTTVVKSEVTGWRAWSNDGCSLIFPSLWVSEGAGPNDRAARFTAPDQGANGVPEQVELIIRNVGAATLEEAANDRVTDLEQDGRKPAVLRSAMEAGEHVLEFTFDHRGQPVRALQRSRLADGRLRTLMFSADPIRFEDDLHIAEAMFASFAWK
jgi:hypothetical protein